jgi:hydrogenase nickel incorporation protein HypA/HybF
MHEFSLALNIVNIAAEHAVKANANKVVTVEVDLGKLTGVQSDTLKSALKSAIKGTVLDGANVIINDLPGKAYCDKCETDFETEKDHCSCPSCGSAQNEIVQGQEIRVKSIEIE